MPKNHGKQIYETAEQFHFVSRQAEQTMKPGDLGIIHFVKIKGWADIGPAGRGVRVGSGGFDN